MSQEYLTGLFWFFDKILIFSCVIFSLFIIGYIFIKEKIEGRRLLNIISTRDKLWRSALSATNQVSNVCLPIVEKANVEEFLDITKDLGNFFPEDISRQLRQYCVNSSHKMREIESIAVNSRKKWLKIEAIIILGHASIPSAADILAKTLGDKDEDVAYFSMLALGEIKGSKAAALLFDFIGKHTFSGYKIASLLEKFLPRDIEEEAIKRLDYKDEVVRFWSLKLLSVIKPVKYILKIKTLTRDSSADVRSACCECLGGLEDISCKEEFLGLLKDPAWFVRMRALRALSKLCGLECLPKILPLMKDNHWLVKEAVKEIMVKNIKASLTFIEECFKQSDEASKKYCIDALIDSGYIRVLLKEALSSEINVRDSARELLKAALRTGMCFGLENIISGFAEDERERIIDLVSELHSGSCVSYIQMEEKGD